MYHIYSLLIIVVIKTGIIIPHYKAITKCITLHSARRVCALIVRTLIAHALIITPTSPPGEKRRGKKKPSNFSRLLAANMAYTHTREGGRSGEISLAKNAAQKVPPANVHRRKPTNLEELQQLGDGGDAAVACQLLPACPVGSWSRRWSGESCTTPDGDSPCCCCCCCCCCFVTFC